MGYEQPEWLLRLNGVPHKINPDNLPLLRRQNDYPLLQHLLFFLTGRYTRVCPLCLEEENGYDRLYWRCRLVLYCPRHRVLLVYSCPTCKKPIPAVRPSLTLCPACKTGDYRAHLHPLLPEDRWLEPGQMSLLRHLGIDETGVGASLVASEETTLDRLPSYDYFEVLSICSSFSKLTSSTGERISRFLMRELPLEMIVKRFLQNLGRSSHENFSPILTHYLSSAWPLRVLAFLKCLQRLLQEAFHYAPQSAVVQRWSQAIVQGNYWCALFYREQPVSQLRNLYRACKQRFKSLSSAERAEDYHGGEFVNERLILKRVAVITPLDNPILPRPSNTHRRSFMPDELLLLKRKDDYHFLQQVLLLDEMTIHSLTLHRFASRLQSPKPPEESPALWRVEERPLLSEEATIRH
jgi:TniQ